jgi:heme-degrading monooxygenase HmoA
MEDEPMIRSVLTLRAKPEPAQAVEDFYHQRGILGRALNFPGCQGATLLRAVDDGPATYLVIADWDDSDAYARWVADPWRDTVCADLADLLVEAGEPVVGRRYEPVTSQAHLNPEELS